MLTLKAIYKDGQIFFLDSVPFLGQHEILVTFLTPEDKAINYENSEIQELKALIRESGLVLTKRELEILRLSQNGKKIEEIAVDLGISHGSARNQLSSVYSKLKVQNRTEAIHKAVRLGLIDPSESMFD